jgi:hypothetical protein
MGPSNQGSISENGQIFLIAVTPRPPQTLSPICTEMSSVISKGGRSLKLKHASTAEAENKSNDFGPVELHLLLTSVKVKASPPGPSNALMAYFLSTVDT